MYTVEILAQNSNGDGPTSEPVSVRTLEDGIYSKNYNGQNNIKLAFLYSSQCSIER